MASLLNASTAGPGGLISTGDSSGVLSLQTAGTTALTVTSAQNVGIGTTSPEAKLNVQGSNSTTGFVKWGDGATASALLGVTNGLPYIQSNNDAFAIGASGSNTFSEVFRFKSDGIFVLKGGSTSAGGTGIAFPASQSASTDVNTLDDYEEGTFTPTILFGGNNTGMVYNRQYAKYTKIGNRVFINMYVSIYPTKGSSTGTATVAGLPFQNVNDGNGSAGAQTACAFNPPQILYSGSVNAYVENNATYIQLATVTEGGFNSGMTDANFQNNSVVQIMCHYQTS
jgi:hypothetical protein